MKLRPLTVGPIVGEVTENRARIWGRGNTHIVDRMPRRCFGAFRVRRKGAQDWGRTDIVKMNPNFDMTGVVIAQRLSPATGYEFQMGYFFSDAEIPDAGFSRDAAQWADASAGSFTTASDDPEMERVIVVGSCRYLLKTFLGDFFDDRGDKTFRSVLHQHENGRRVDQFLMVGDQIYADDLNVFNPDKTVAQFYQRYRDAFSQEWIRKLMSRVPTYMTLDDHEIEDNWPSKASEQDWKTLFPVAIHAYQAYQLSHSPCIPVRRGRLHGTPDRLWYRYADGCCDVFVTDSRTEREIDSEQTRAILGRDQMQALKRWLNDGSGRVKLVVTSVPFFPDSSREENADKWSGFVRQRHELLEHIERHRIEPVVFLSGDVHASLSAEAVSPSGLVIYSVVSSAFFWPYPHPAARSFRRQGVIDGGRAGNFTLRNVSRVISDDNFTRLTIGPRSMQVEVYPRKDPDRPVSRNFHAFPGDGA